MNASGSGNQIEEPCPACLPNLGVDDLFDKPRALARKRGESLVGAKVLKAFRRYSQTGPDEKKRFKDDAAAAILSNCLLDRLGRMGLS